MNINTKVIQSFNPCQDRLDNWTAHYSDFNGSIQEFLDLSEITRSDKRWVLFRLPIRFYIPFYLSWIANIEEGA
jgi:hypothetical protein